MMGKRGRTANVQRMEQVWSVLEQCEGLDVREIAQATGLGYAQVNGVLPTMQSNGYLLSEDDDGRLYPFQRVEVEG